MPAFKLAGIHCLVPADTSLNDTSSPCVAINSIHSSNIHTEMSSFHCLQDACNHASTTSEWFGQKFCRSRYRMNESGLTKRAIFHSSPCMGRIEQIGNYVSPRQEVTWLLFLLFPEAHVRLCWNSDWQPSPSLYIHLAVIRCFWKKSVSRKAQRVILELHWNKQHV